MNDNGFGRRQFLKSAAVGSGALAGAAALNSSAFGFPTFERKTKRVILIAFAGGVRTRETFGTPANIPTLKAMADEGVLFPRARTANLGHYGAALSIFTGVSEARGIRENARGPYPTLFEYVRKDLGLSASDVWISTSGGAQQTNYSYSVHSEYGARFGGNTLDGDGIFNKEFKGLLDRLGRPREMGAAEKELLKKMRRGIEPRNDKEGSLNSAESAAKVEEYILGELTRGTAEIRGAGAADGKALRVARNLISLFKPKLTAVALQSADVAHGSYNGYVEVIRQNDASIKEIWDAVKGDPALADSTAILVVPEFGRDADLNSRRGLDHGDGSDDLRYVAGVAWGPDFRKGSVVNRDVRVIDFCPTVCDLLGTSAQYARGKKLKGLMA